MPGTGDCHRDATRRFADCFSAERAGLTPDGGMLAEMLPLFRLGLGEPIAGRRAYVSWVVRDDVVRAIRHVLSSDVLGGPLDTVAPSPATSRELAQALAAVLHRPALLPLPAWLVRTLLGSLAKKRC